MQKIRIDFDNPGLPQHISAVENDSQSRFFQATLYENGKAYTAPEGATYSIMYRGFGPQNQGWYDTINDGAGKRAACAVSGNVVTCEIARQALQVPGHVSIVLCVTTGKGYMLKSWPIECDCKNDRYDSTAEIQSFFYITQVTNADWTQAIQAVEELKNTIDPTLSVSGKAADAAKVGEAVGQMKEDLDVDRTILASVSAPSEILLNLNFVQGAINNTDPFTIYSSASRVCMPEILCVEDLDALEFTCNTGWQADLWLFTDKTLASMVGYTNWVDGYTSLLAQKYIFIMGRKSDNSNITPAEFKANVSIKAKRHSIVQDLDKISFFNQAHIYSKDDLIYGGTIFDNGRFVASGNGFTSTLFRAIPDDTISFSIVTEAPRKAFVVYNNTGEINYSINGLGTNTDLNHTYTFQNNDCWFAFVSYQKDAAKDRFTAAYTSNRKMFNYNKGVNSIITMSDFNGMFYIGGLNASYKSWVQSSNGIVQRKDFPVKLSIGDRIYLTDTTGIHWRVMYLPSGSTTREISAWQTTSEYVVKESGQYWIEIETSPAIAVTNMDSLVSIIRVVKNDNFYDTLSEDNIANQRTDWIVKSINHRGMNLIAPENTMPAFQLSAKLGWKYIETDVAKTSDGVIVLLHDETINRTARNADGTEIEQTISINNITYDEALTYDFGIWKGTQYAGTKIPTLDEFLKFCRKASICPYIDLGSSLDNDLIESVVSIIKRNGMVAHTTIVATNASALRIVKDMCGYIRLGLIAIPSAQTVADIKSLRTGKNEVFLDTQSGNYGTEAIIQLLVADDIPLETYTPNTSEEIEAIDSYVTGITSDYLVAGKILYNKNI